MKIIRNAIQCKHCNDIIESKHTHDFRQCTCKAVAVDGGRSYQRRLYPGGDPADHFVDLNMEVEA